MAKQIIDIPFTQEQFKNLPEWARDFIIKIVSELETLKNPGKTHTFIVTPPNDEIATFDDYSMKYVVDNGYIKVRYNLGGAIQVQGYNAQGKSGYLQLTPISSGYVKICVAPPVE